MAKPRAYVETSVISYLTAQPSRDLVVAAHQEVTREWWSGRDRFDLLVSEAGFRPPVICTPLELRVEEDQ